MTVKKIFITTLTEKKRIDQKPISVAVEKNASIRHNVTENIVLATFPHSIRSFAKQITFNSFRSLLTDDVISSKRSINFGQISPTFARIYCSSGHLASSILLKRFCFFFNYRLIYPGVWRIRCFSSTDLADDVLTAHYSRFVNIGRLKKKKK